jgi:hypothetical protein
MAVLTAAQCVRVWADGWSDRTCLYALRNVTTGDTADLTGDYLKVIRAVMLGTTVSGAAAASVSGTVVTMPTGLAGDAGFLLVWGCSGANP